MKKSFIAILILLLITALSSLDAQNFSRVIQLQRSRMNGPDVTRVQRRLLSLGFRKTGAADGWYGPLTEGSVKIIQYFMGFPQDGRVTKAFWDMLFDSKQDGLLKNISIIADYAPGAFTATSKRNGPNNDFDEFQISSRNDEVKAVLFQHINNGLIIARFRIWYVADAIFMIRDIYYGDNKTHVYLKTTGGFYELINGVQQPADSALEGILTRTKEGIDSAGLKVQPLIPAFAPADSPAPANQSASPAQSSGPSQSASDQQAAAKTESEERHE
ncbi:MAG: peptidoglycan-binding protein [Treponema sp.]|nr:peptidoglycan-binding protein [Treponema sp.]